MLAQFKYKYYICIVNKNKQHLELTSQEDNTGNNIMKTTFNLTEELHARRDLVIEQYNELTKGQFFDGITLRNYMLEVIKACQVNRIRTAKSLDKQLPIFLYYISYEHNRIASVDNVTEALKRKYAGTAFMAMV